MKTEARQILTKVYGYRQLRPGQQELVDGILEKKDVLGV